MKPFTLPQKSYVQNFKQQLAVVTPENIIFIFLILTFFCLPSGTAPPLLSIGLASLVWFFSGRIFHIKPIVKQSWFFPVIPFLFLPWIGLLYSQDFDLGMDYALKTKYWVAVLISAGLTFNEKRFKILLQWFWAGLLIGSILAFFQSIGVMAQKGGAPGFGIAHTFISMYLIIGILTVSFSFKKTRSSKNKLILFFLFLAFLFHLTILRGRGGYLIFGLLSPLIANHLMYKFSLKIKIAATIVLVCSLSLSPVVREVVNNTFVDLSGQEKKLLKGEDVTKFPRPFMVRESLKIIVTNPLFGIGTGSISVPTKADGHLLTHPHNNFLYMGVSFGIFGILACCWLFWKMFKLSWGSRNTELGYFIFSTCIVLFLSGMLDTQILNTGTLLLLSLTYGMLNHLRNPAICDNMDKIEQN